MLGLVLVLWTQLASATIVPQVVPPLLDEKAIKKSVSPCEDFYQFACGSWLDKTEMPPDLQEVSRQGTALSDSIDKRLHHLLEKYVEQNGHGEIPEAPLLADFYSSCRSREDQVQTSWAVAMDHIRRIRSIRDMRDLFHEVAELHRLGVNVLFEFHGMVDQKNSYEVIGEFFQGGMGFEDKDYYLDEAHAEIQVEYRKYITRLLVLAGGDPTRSEHYGNAIFAFERNLALKSLSTAEQMDPIKTFHQYSLDEFMSRFPGEWSEYLAVLDAQPEKVNVDAPAFFMAFERLESLPIGMLRAYLEFRWLERVAPYMGGEMARAQFEFWEVAFAGAEQPLPEWQLCTQAVENSLGYAMAHAYMANFDSDSIRTQAQNIIQSIQQTFVANLNVLSWLDNSTRSEALTKASGMGAKIGGPDQWYSMNALEIHESEYLQNSLNISRFERNRDMARLNRRPDRKLWDMMPWEINAYYDTSFNDFVLPFGILQPPSMDPAFSEGANMGTIGGGTVGHEMAHGFDRGGRMYDARGNLNDWWSPETERHFNTQAQCFIRQANAYPIEEIGRNVDGEQTLDENLADQGGVKIGYQALENDLLVRPEAPVWNGYSERQQYWIGYAQSWCIKYTPELLRDIVVSDVHPPAEFRVNAVVMNRPEFARDFKCEQGQAMAPRNRCDLW